MATSQVSSYDSLEGLTEQEFKSELVEELNEIAEDLGGVSTSHWTFSLYFVLIASCLVLLILVHALVRLCLRCRNLRKNQTAILNDDSEDNYQVPANDME